MNKPKFLYHASPKNNLEVLEPRAESLPGDWKDGDAVFATISPEYASFFIVSTKDVWALMGNIGGVFYFVCADKERFLREDDGGTVYKLLSETFIHYKGYEWYSRESVKPVGKTYIKSGLDFMIESGVQVYFLDEKTFEKITISRDNGAGIMNNVESENEKRGLKVKKLDIYKRRKNSK